MVREFFVFSPRGFSFSHFKFDYRLTLCVFPGAWLLFSLKDEIIKDRRVSQQKASKRVQKKSTNSDRSIATGKAKREAAARARRGLSQKKKPDKMEVEKEVKRQTKKTNVAKKKNEKKATGGKLPPKSSARTKKKANAKEEAPVQIVVGGSRPPSKKAVEAAVKGMEGKHSFFVRIV